MIEYIREVAAERGLRSALLDVVAINIGCLGVLHHWVKPECGYEDAWQGGTPWHHPCECSWKRVCVRCGQTREARDDEG